MYTSFNARALGLSLTAVETVELAARNGFEGADLLVRDLDAAGDNPSEIRARMDALGIRGGAFPLPVDWRGDAEKFREDLEALPRLAEIAAALGLTRTGTWVLPETSERPAGGDEGANHFRATAAMHVERLGAIARVLDQQGIRLGLEVIGVESFRTGRGLPFVHRMEELDRKLGDLWAAAPNLGILLDAFHLHAADEPLEAALKWGVEKVVWVHVADLPAGFNGERSEIRDPERGLPGENGAVDSRRALQRLADLGYDGPVTAEPLAGCRSLRGKTDDEAARHVASTLRSVWPTHNAAPGRPGA